MGRVGALPWVGQIRDVVSEALLEGSFGRLVRLFRCCLS